MFNLLLRIILLAALALPAWGANKYVRDGAAGTGTGADWINAYEDFPAVLTRGDTYYVADGTYAGYTWNDAVSGTTVITIKKATVDDHGTATGWVDSYGDGQALWDSWTITTSYWQFDGQVGDFASDWPGYVAHGFKVARTMSATSQKLIHMATATLTGVEIKHTEAAFLNTVGTWLKGGDAIYCNGGVNLTFSYLWLHDVERVNIYMITTTTNVIVDHCFIEENGQGQIDDAFSPTEHSELVNGNGGMIFRNSIFRRFRSTGGLMILQSAINVPIHGNIFIQDQSSALNGSTLVDGFTGGTMTNVSFVNNTVYGVTKNAQIMSIGTWVTSEIRNNVFVTLRKNTSFILGANPTKSHNWFYDVAADFSGETSAQIGTGDPFVSSATFDFRLLVPTNDGIDTSYTTDASGNPYNLGGVWARGALAYVDGSPTLAAVADQSMAKNGELIVSLTIGDDIDSAASLTLTRTSGNTTVLPLANCVLGGSGANRTITFTPAASQTGSSLITMRVTDSQANYVETTFTVTVNDVPFPNQTGGRFSFLRRR